MGYIAAFDVTMPTLSELHTHEYFDAIQFSDSVQRLPDFGTRSRRIFGRAHETMAAGSLPAPFLWVVLRGDVRASFVWTFIPV